MNIVIFTLNEELYTQFYSTYWIRQKLQIACESDGKMVP